MTTLVNGILGYPLKKPRSISIWRNYFKKKGLKATMKKFEVKPISLNNFFSNIKKMREFKATAVTMPYKISVIKYMHDLDSYAQKAKSVNLIIKKNKKLIGFNTDVYGAYESIKKIIPKYKLIIIIGLGGTGSAIFNFLKKKRKKNEFIIITSKKPKNMRNVLFKKKLDEKILSKKSLIINCTPLGSDLSKNYLKKSPIKKSLVKKINKDSTIFDVIYSPKKTILSKLLKEKKIKYLNGILMNTLQAKKALSLAFEN